MAKKGEWKHFQHRQVILDVDNQIKYQNSLWPTKAFQGIKALDGYLNVFGTDGKIFQKMWDYSGGLKVDENGHIE